LKVPMLNRPLADAGVQLCAIRVMV
jgi:hypothetical protein